MKKMLKSGFVLLLLAGLSACSSDNPFGGEVDKSFTVNSPVIAGVNSTTGETTELEVVELKIAVITIE